jgi:spore germination cell wall hydrolase CwlJ-like protein|tara:strand:+ start:2668 stop:3093 length:426 start_codon:yes stop_codon:yes gene_type:complete
MIETALVCLALNIYHEARNQPTIGQVAVGQVVMNRVRDERFPDTVCEVVKQGQTYSWQPDLPIRNKCQFSWWCDGKSDRPQDKKAWEHALLLASGVYLDKLHDFVEGSTHYHAIYVLPDWHESKQYVVRINDHVFYKWEND